MTFLSREPKNYTLQLVTRICKPLKYNNSDRCHRYLYTPPMMKNLNIKNKGGIFIYIRTIYNFVSPVEFLILQWFI